MRHLLYASVFEVMVMVGAALQEVDISKSKKTLVTALHSLRNSISLRDKSQRDMQVLQTTIQKETEEFEAEFKQKVAVRGAVVSSASLQRSRQRPVPRVFPTGAHLREAAQFRGSRKADRHHCRDSRVQQGWGNFAPHSHFLHTGRRGACAQESILLSWSFT